MIIVEERRRALEALLNAELPIEHLKANLTKYSWDSNVDLATLVADHVANVLSRFIGGRMAAADVEDWANAVEGRDDVGFDRKNELELRELIYELANPLLTHPLTEERARQLLQMIRIRRG
jgi:hypothetical protein